MNSNELMHHGIHGMRWGVRRYQNKDGSLTVAGRKRVDKLDSEYQRLTGMKLNKKKSSADVKKTESKPKSKRFTETVMNDVITPAATDVGKQLARSMFADGVNKVFNLEGDNKVYANNKKK